MGVYDQWSKLTPAEKAFIATHPQYAVIIRNSKDIAYNETKAVMGHNGLNDKSDAFRHCFWSSTLSRDMGYADAYLFVSAHESDPANPPDQKAMDMHNNLVGLSIGSTFFTEVNHAADNIVPFSISGMINSRLWSNSNAELSAMCKEALDNGRLKVIAP
ncbi:DUF6973 domain-containing protein [Vannielia litorea]|uniref:DUF6973 domain-containing protein n=1 Tax=Vannielia litorea TaxID=1217970 RepID=UPI001C93A28D|nr:hypothetical protein [Vannielia litorea]MBY6047355.1 hypothetical protein [Vannielia litorea]MBY6074769.1 hypothetical protein [Vannielia litorea]